MTEHASEIIPVLLTVLGFLAVYVLNGIKSEIKEVKTTIGKIEVDLRGGMAALDRRVTTIETRCEIKHGVGQD